MYSDQTISWIYIYDYEGIRLCVSTMAARMGHLHVLKWLRNKFIYYQDDITLPEGYKRMIKLIYDGSIWNESVPVAAASNGHFGILEWLLENGCPWDAGSKHRSCETWEFGNITMDYTKGMSME